MDEKIKKIREKIDRLDLAIFSLLEERLQVIEELRKVKEENNLSLNDPFREDQVLDHLRSFIQKKAEKESIENVYHKIMDEAKKWQIFFSWKSFPFQSIGFIGMGLIGGSIAKAIKMKNPSVRIKALHTHDQDLILATEQGVVDELYSLSNLLQKVDLLILATPIDVILEIAKKIKKEKMLSSKILIMDVGSVKKEISSLFEKLTDSEVEMMSTHPLSGKETSGFSSSEGMLFTGNPWIVTPHKKNKISSLAKIEEFIKWLGSFPVQLDASSHDQKMALISHTPKMIAKAFLDYVNLNDPESIFLSGPGFTSFTRIAKESNGLLENMMRYNHENISKTFLSWLKNMRSFL